MHTAVDSAIIYEAVYYPDTSYKSIHIYLALCDNFYQGIIPVNPVIGNGQDPDNNLYWGAGYGLRAFFRKSKEWKRVRFEKPDSIILERIIYKHVSKNYYLIADAYNGKYIKQCTEDFLFSVCGSKKDTIIIDSTVIGVAGFSNLVAYMGHDGLMDFTLEDTCNNVDNKSRDVIILACISAAYFNDILKIAKANPLVLTTGLMCPESYTIHDAITGYLNNETTEQIRKRAVKSYAKYQRQSEESIEPLFVSGFH
ncbi:MAG: hypothetical protein JXR58_00150 [Bacteroidales bacterium]|nr:hypothetical protein [Bacteroidales bacterium]